MTHHLTLHMSPKDCIADALAGNWAERRRPFTPTVSECPNGTVYDYRHMGQVAVKATGEARWFGPGVVDSVGEWLDGARAYPIGIPSGWDRAAASGWGTTWAKGAATCERRCGAIALEIATFQRFPDYETWGGHNWMLESE